MHFVQNLNIWSFSFIPEKNISDYRMKLTLFILNCHINPFLILLPLMLLLCWFSSLDPAPCSFPFIYRNKSYYSCTTDGTLNNQLWCATSPNYDNDSKWKSCSFQGKRMRNNCLEHLWVIWNTLLVWEELLKSKFNHFPSVAVISSTFCSNISVCRSSPDSLLFTKC